MPDTTTVRFRELLSERSLGWNSSDNVPSHFYLDLNDGPIYAQRDPERVIEIIRIAHELKEYDPFGEWRYLLDLVAVRSELNDRHVHWYRPYYDDNSGKWISLKEWLTENGMDVSPFCAA